jgi:hypothetical protein
MLASGSGEGREAAKLCSDHQIGGRPRVRIDVQRPEMEGRQRGKGDGGAAPLTFG